MKNKDILIRIWPFFVVFFIYLFIGLALIQYYGRDNLQLIINKYHTPFWDKFFQIYTELGTTGFFIILIIYIVWKSNWLMLLYLTLTELFAGVTNLGIKKLFFENVYRPSYYFYQKNIPIHLPKGEGLTMSYTFPSGHTLVAVVITITLCLLTKNRWLQLLFSFQFISIAYSRMYLSKHFMIDTLGGSVFALFTYIFVYYLLNQERTHFLDRPIRKSNVSRN